MNRFQMGVSDKELFLSGDEGRAKVRQMAAQSNPEAESIQIEDLAGDVFDVVNGADFDSEDTSPGLAVVLTDEQLADKRLTEALDASDHARVEEVIRPAVFEKLRDEARAEIREEFRVIIQGLRADKVSLQRDIVRLTEGVSSLTRKNEKLVADNELLRASKE